MHVVVRDTCRSVVMMLLCGAGVLAVRTVLSILPTLSREYDFYFKQFNSVPVNPPPNMKSKDASNGAKGAVMVDKKKGEVAPKKDVATAASGGGGSVGSSDEGEGGGERGVEEEGEDGEGAEGSDTEGKDCGVEGAPGGVCSVGSEGTAMESGEGVKSDTENPGNDWRGSRCFEVLGIDVMVDSHLKPWLIEFNHLPRYVKGCVCSACIAHLLGGVFNMMGCV